MALTEQVILDIQLAESQISQLGSRLEDLGQPIDVPVHIDDTQIRLTAEQFREVQAAIEAGVDEARALQVATGQVGAEATTTEAAIDRVADALGVSASDARELTQGIAESTRASTDLQRDLEQVARSMGLSEEEARQFAGEVRRASGETRDLSNVTESVERTWISIGARIVAAATAAFGIQRVLSAGFGRFTAIEDATRALSVQLGDAAEAGELLGEVLEVVRGTPFNLDQFSDAAAQLVAFGVEAERIPGILTAIGEAAATRGSDAPQFVDRLITVFGQVSAVGRITMNDINRIAAAGVNALAILANAFGVTTEEMREMISSGIVPVDQALDTLVTGIVEGTDGIAGATVAMGGTMEGLRDTLSGAAGGLDAAVARLGAAFIELASPGIILSLRALTDALDAANDSAAGFGGVAGQALANLPGAAEQVFGSIGSAFGFFSNTLLGANKLLLGQVDQAMDSFRSAGRAFDEIKVRDTTTQSIRNLITTIQSGVSPVAAFESVLVNLRDADLPDDAFANLVDRLAFIAGIGPEDAAGLFELAETVRTVGSDIGFSGTQVDILRFALLDLARDGLDPADRKFFQVGTAVSNMAANFREAPGPIDQTREALGRFSTARVDAAIADLETQFGRLPDALGAAREALKDEGGEMVTDIATFLEQAREQFAAQALFASNIEAARALGLDNLVEAAQQFGIEFAPILADAIRNPAVAQEFENASNEFASTQAANLKQALVTEMLQQFAGGVTIPLDVQLQLENVRLPGNVGLLENVIIPGGRASGTQVVQNFNGFTPSSPDLARAAQSTNSLTAVAE